MKWRLLHAAAPICPVAACVTSALLMSALLMSALLMSGLLKSDLAYGQVLPTPQGNFGPGTIAAHQARNFRDQRVTACGLGSYPVPNLHGIDLGEPGLGGLAGPILMILPPDMSPGNYLGKTVCVTGVVTLQTLRTSEVPTITVELERDIAIVNPR